MDIFQLLSVALHKEGICLNQSREMVSLVTVVFGVRGKIRFRKEIHD